MPLANPAGNNSLHLYLKEGVFLRKNVKNAVKEKKFHKTKKLSFRLAFIVFYDEFFKQRDERVHNCSQNAKYENGAHNEIKLKYLTAVDD